MIKSVGICLTILLLAIVGSFGLSNSLAQAQAPAQDAAPPKDPAVERGRKQFGQSCGFCHGVDATGARGPDLLRSPLVAHDVKGDLLGDVMRHGRPDKGMPAIPATDDQVADIAAFLHSQIAEAMNSADVPQGYPAERLLTGNAEAGKAYFNGAGGCKNCHSPTGDLAEIANKYSPIELEAHMLYPEGKLTTVVVTLPSGEKIAGPLVHIDEFSVALRDASGEYRSFARDQVKVEVQDRLAAHRNLLDKLTQSEIHNLFAYLESLN
jgi:cytochrome c oxidase cbb3-type subunit 3